VWSGTVADDDLCSVLPEVMKGGHVIDLFIEEIIARVQLKINLWPWVSRGLPPRRNDQR
jgi:hypothetical protein